ncbi:MAG: glycosyltransferase family 25 protein [Phycisphaerales bacterium]|nr:glycosyltransferase family 25 protein [Phycisphaerales bacterium]
MTIKPFNSVVESCRFADVFDHIYILNLPDRADRRRDILRELALAHFPSPGYHLALFPAIRTNDPAGFPSVGVRGCYLSHLAIFKDALRRQFARILILEDDLRFSPLFTQHDALLAALAQKHTWHFAWFGHILPPVHPPPLVPFLEPTSQPLITAHFYALDHTVLPPLIDFFEAILTRQPGDPAGGPMYNDAACTLFRQKYPQYLTLIARPSLGHQRPSRSDIVPKWFDRQPLLRQTAALLRRFKRSQ